MQSNLDSFAIESIPFRPSSFWVIRCGKAFLLNRQHSQYYTCLAPCFPVLLVICKCRSSSSHQKVNAHKSKRSSKRNKRNNTVYDRFHFLATVWLKSSAQATSREPLPSAKLCFSKSRDLPLTCCTSFQQTTQSPRELIVLRTSYHGGGISWRGGI